MTNEKELNPMEVYKEFDAFNYTTDFNKKYLFMQEFQQPNVASLRDVKPESSKSLNLFKLELPSEVVAYEYNPTKI